MLRRRLPHGLAAGCALLAACTCQALRDCGSTPCEDEEEDEQSCCPLGPAPNAPNTTRCCGLQQDSLLESVGWVTRKLSGVLILLLLFAMGYFIQRMACPRPRRQRARQQHHPQLQQQALTLRDLPRTPRAPLPQLPAYDEVKHLPSYEESMQEVGRDSSRENLLVSPQERKEESVRTGWHPV